MYRYYRSWLLVGYAGWVENGIDTNRFPCCRFAMPEVDLRDANPCESSRNVKCLTEVCFHVLRTRKIYVSLFHRLWLPVVRVNALRIESNRKVPQTNRLSLGVLDMDAFLMQCYSYVSNINENRNICTRNFKLHLFNLSVHSFCFWVPSIIINMTHNQWLVLLLPSRQLISETSDPFKGQPVWYAVIIHCRCDHHRRVRLSATQIRS